MLRSKPTAGVNATGDESLITADDTINQHIITETEKEDTIHHYDDHELQQLQSRNKSTVKLIFYLVSVVIYIFLLITIFLNTSNTYHAFSWLATIFSVSYILCVIHTLLFSTNLHHHTIEYTSMNGMSHNYIPHKLIKFEYKPWNSISHMSHIRGSSVYKWHTALMNYGSFSVNSTNTNILQFHQLFIFIIFITFVFAILCLPFLCSS